MSVEDTGSATWVTSMKGRAMSVHVRRCRLSVIDGPDRGLSQEFQSPEIRVGARRSNQLRLSDERASGFHFEISLTERGYRLKDLDSTNGTFVHGLRVRDVYIPPGSEIALGDTVLRFEPLSEAVEVALADRDRFGGLIGQSVAMRAAFAQLEQVAAGDVTVLITGETGTGKELAAEAVHQHSPRAAGPLIVVDCGAIAPGLIESELFGHERGAFTGAQTTREGAFELADGGTLFLDEIGELPLEMQPKLLRALENRQVRRVGGGQMRKVDIRIVAATNRDLAVEVNRGRFREDLYYRLAVAQIQLPALRERREDIPLLIRHFLSSLPSGDHVQLAPRTVEHLTRQSWPGNVRELRNAIERAVYMRDVRLAQPPPEAGSAAHASVGAAPNAAPSPAEAAIDPSSPADAVAAEIPFKVARQAVTDQFERQYMEALLDRCQGNISAAARAAGLDRMSIYRILQRLQIKTRD